MGPLKTIKFNTNQAVLEKVRGKPRVIVAPLDWGLGHATRCIPIIRKFIEQNCDVWLAGDGAIETLLTTEFPSLPFLRLPGYQITYAGTGSSFTLHLLRQLPKILAAIRTEKRLAAQWQGEFQFDAIISDNRFGFYHPRIPSVFMTHQLTIKTSLGRAAEKLLRWVNYRYIKRFSTCWVPDAAAIPFLSGELGHPDELPSVPVVYLGTISRFAFQPLTVKPDHLVIILSGPEPQRSVFEDMLINEIVHYRGTVDFVRGLPGEETILPSTNQIHFYNHLPAAELHDMIARAEWVVSRSGYTTVMDILRLRKKSILVATPGQPEQEYLAENLFQEKIVFSVKQGDFSLKKALNEAKSFDFLQKLENDDLLEKVISEFVAGLSL